MGSGAVSWLLVWLLWSSLFTEATNARKSVAFSDLIASKPAPVLPTVAFQSQATRVLKSSPRRWFPNEAREFVIFWVLRVLRAQSAPTTTALRDDPETGP